MKHYILILIIVFCQLSCKQERVPSNDIDGEVVSPSSSGPSQEEIDQLLERAIKNGDERAYNRVAAHYFLNEQRETIFYYAFVMATKYKSAEAYFHLYLIMGDIDSDSIRSIDELDAATRDIRLYCLLRSYELNKDFAKSRVEDLFPKGIPSSKSYCQTICDK
ncbi:hypothetical protein [Ohtaekwangia koreensis]|uniref:Tetratricopeptide repeat protein n=1 Tax=Ohtaekwangia koreensis TaxID=688867 RepID=A0A1T5MAC5_9BACT|nr:hypothetical protein [Ohtaekwangia koreensis]SKC85201.1 hypothetical protein SAMN05660236_4863 [Ohtaekwangia koreensis]